MSVDQETTTALIGLGGVAVGAVAGLSGTWLTIGQQHRSERRQELRNLIAGYWASTDQAWRSAQGLEHAVIGLGGAGQNHGVAAIYEERRQESMRRLHEAEVQAGQQLALLRILHPAVALQATVLLAASSHYEVARREEQRATRSKALTAFETAARQVIAGLPWWKRSWRRVRWFRRTLQAKRKARELLDELNS